MNEWHLQHGEMCVVVIAWVASAIKRGFHTQSMFFFCLFFENVTNSDL